MAGSRGTWGKGKGRGRVVVKSRWQMRLVGNVHTKWWEVGLLNIQDFDTKSKWKFKGLLQTSQFSGGFIKTPKIGLKQRLSFSGIGETTTGYTFTPCVGSFTSPSIDTR